jgi:hypothetical protein
MNKISARDRKEISDSAESAVKIITTATEAAAKTIASAALEAAKVVAATAAETAKTANVSSNQDHDLLIRIATQVEQVIKDVGDIKTNTVGRIDQLELNTITKIDHEKVVNDIVLLKNKNNWFIGVGATLGIVVTLVVYIWTTQIGSIQKTSDKMEGQITDHINNSK